MKFVQLAILAALLVATPNASAQRASLEGGIGFSDDPTAFLLSAELPIHVNRNVSVGPLLQLGLDDDFVFIAASLDARYTFHLPGSNEFVRRFKPFAQGGGGLMYIDVDKRPGDDDDASFLLHFGAGAHYALTDRIAVGSKFNFNIMPDDVFRENFIFSWEVARIQFGF